MIKKFKEVVKKYLLNFFELQLVITLMSLPILITWGIPISYMSPVSNLLFTPLLIGFLWTSALFSICALLYIPCKPLVWILDQITNLWMWLLSFAKSSWLIGFSHEMLGISITICIGIVILYSLYKPTSKQAISVLLLFFTCIISLQKITTNNCFKQIGSLPLIAVKISNKTYLIDYGALCSKQNFYTNIDYNIIPELIKHTGITNIDTLILCKPSKNLTKAALQFSHQMNVKNIIVTQKQHCYHNLCIACNKENITVLPLQKTKQTF